MAQEHKLNEKAKDKLNEWKGSLEHLNMQLHLGADEARDEFEKQKQNLVAWLDAASETLKIAEGIGEEKVMELKASLEELRVQAALGKAESVEALREQQEKLSKGIYKLQNTMTEAHTTAEGRLSDFTQYANDRLIDFRTRFDLFKLHSHLAQMDASEAWEEKRNELSVKLNDLNTILESNKETASEKWDSFSSEMSESWKHFRTAFNG